jgi:hypothetical protein
MTVDKLNTKQREVYNAIPEGLRAAFLAALTKSTTEGGLRVSEKGAVSLYGLGRFPVTLYASQWDSVLGMSGQIRAFIDANRGKLKFKPE